MLLACPGLDHVSRGFETFARECFAALRGAAGIDVELVKGSGEEATGESTVPTLRRETRLARRIGALRHTPPFVVEHASYAAALAPRLVRHPPDIVYFSEWHVGVILARARALLRLPYRLVLCNGALAPGPYDHLDHVQQLLPSALEYVVARGEAPERQSVLPLGVAMEPRLPARRAEETGQLRDRLGLPRARRIVLSVGALNAQKRHDYTIEEVARLPPPRPFLLIVGQAEEAAPGIAELATRRLGPEGHSVRSVESSAMPSLYRAADVFVLASLWESFGRVLVEASSHGLPCLSHDYPVMNWVLGELARPVDMERPGRLSLALAELTQADLSNSARLRRHAGTYERFSWDRLAPRYVEMLRRAAGFEG